MKPALIQEFVALAKADPSCDHFNKVRFLALGKQMAKKVAADLGLALGSFEIRGGLGGWAVSGETWLHAETLYVQFGVPQFGPSILFRSCSGRKDSCGGPNAWAPYDDLVSDYEGFLGRLRSLMTPATSSRAA
jgi:hypothetical protein